MMSTKSMITTALGLMLIGMSSPGHAAEEPNTLRILISGSSTTYAANSRALQQQATDIIVARLAAAGHSISVVDTTDPRLKAKLRHVSLTSKFRSKHSVPDISINVRTKLRIIDKTYTRHATLHLHSVIRNARRSTILGRLRAPLQSWRIPENSDADCISDNASLRISRPAGFIARTITRKLKNIKLRHRFRAIKKANLVTPTLPIREEITLRLVGLDSATIRDIEDYLVVIPGNQRVRQTESSNSITTFAITRDKNAPPLQSFLQKMLKQLGLAAALTRKKHRFTLNAHKSGKTGTSPINW
ncbi:MAG: hypothetical protein GKS01_13625 [Alphaproteobacteria bacterium]|nr:hypothetical protein [Alphaproteobacteria bacterium]